MRKRNLTTIIICLLSITIISIGIAFIYVSMKLSKLEKNQPFYEVKITNVEEGTIINGTKNEILNNYNITDNNKTVNFNFKLNNIKDSISYKINIKNTGTLTSQIDNIIEKTNYNKDYLNIKYNDVLGEVIEPNEEVTVEVTITPKNNDILLKDITYQMTILTSNIN